MNLSTRLQGPRPFSLRTKTKDRKEAWYTTHAGQCRFRFAQESFGEQEIGQGLCKAFDFIWITAMLRQGQYAFCDSNHGFWAFSSKEELRDAFKGFLSVMYPYDKEQLGVIQYYLK